MQYFVSFIEGIITFISPCLLPMLPVYLTYFAGGGERSTKKTLLGASGFVLGFTAVFTALGALAGTLGSFLKQYETAVNIILGLIVIVFGLNYIGVFKLKLFSGMKQGKIKTEMGFFSAFLFGVVFSVGWTPCVGAFLGSALAMASSEGDTLKGVIMLLLYSLGLGVPFLLSAVLIDKLKGTFTFIKKNYKTINTVCGIFLIVIGLLMMTGLLNRFLTILS
ncbi:MAG: sulfite exporter TauE/SafE family protein [Clostridia bacterium]|nr:cytochrome c biogenesis protein CcdA [Oscillospiraceae bacterium]MBR2410357.1 sulfite exporter TauE/SafE family protein [Clostridia bacterium]